MIRDVNHPEYQRLVLDLLIEADDEGLVAGEEPKQRAFKNIMRVMSKLGVNGYTLAGFGQAPEIDLINALQRDFMYRQSDIAEGGIHFGAFMFRDLFARLTIPIVFGEGALNPFDLLDFSENQKRWLASDKDACQTLQDQFIDLLDLAYGILEAGSATPLPNQSKSLLALSHYQLEAAAGALCRAYGYAGSTQSALLAVELASKAALLFRGLDSQELARRPYGHNLSALLTKLSDFEPGFDLDRTLRCLSTFPDYVGNRYEAIQPERREAGHILMKCQFIVGEIMRQLSDRDFRASSNITEPRYYPI